jgi:uncharacterized protein (TIGR02679 family)
MIADETRLREVLGGAGISWLVERARARLSSGKGDGSVTLAHATPAQRDAIERLLGRHASRGTSITVRLADVEAMLRHAGISDTLVEAVEALGGPLVDARARRQSAEAVWAALFDAVEDDGQPRPWLDELRRTGLVRRLSRNDPIVARTLLGHAREIERRLPARGVPLAELAAAVTGDSHALDPGTPLGTIAVRLAAFIGGSRTSGASRPSPEEGAVVSGALGSRRQSNAEPQIVARAAAPWDGAEGWRDAWTGAGVLCDELSAPALVLNLPAAGDRVTDRALRLHAEAGEPYRLTTRQLLREPPTFPALPGGRTVYVCENPTVLAAAANRHGAASAPLVCLEGQPRTAARLLLDRLAASGIRLAYHGDFDWGGIRIGNVVMRRHGAVPWRFTSAEYRAARGGRPLEGTSVAALWDASLEAAMIEIGRAVHEEEVLDTLLADLA